MDKNKILSVLNDEQLLERFGNTLIDEINSDDESVEDVARHLLELCLCDEHADNFFIAICGWNVDSLLRKIDML